MSNNIKVSIKLKPAKSAQNYSFAIRNDGIDIAGHHFSYANTILQGSSQKISYDSIAREFLSGNDVYSCTLIAYGQTGSGKTYTIFGPAGCLTEAELANANNSIPETWGILPRLLMNALQDASSTVQVSAIEIYGNQPFDLLSSRKPMSLTNRDSSDLVVTMTHPLTGKPVTNGFLHPVSCTCITCYGKRRAKKTNAQSSTARASNQSPILAGETFQSVKSATDIAQICRLIETTRVSQSHLLNDRSSRSHCLVKVELTKKSGKSATQRTLLIVDLAGSERFEKSGVQGKNYNEAVAINQSLTVLGRVILQLRQKATHVAFRDSVLTTLLRPSLEGSAVTSVVVCLSLDPENVDESISSLRYGQSMSSVKMDVQRNESRSIEADKSIISAQISTLKEKKIELEKAGQQGGFQIGASSHEKQMLQENFDRYEIAKCTLQKVKEMCLENKNDRKLKLQLITCQSEVDHFKDMTIRQKTIKNLWNEPSAIYVATMGEIKSLESRLASF